MAAKFAFLAEHRSRPLLAELEAQNLKPKNLTP
jgi:hypothetical protein